MPKTKRTLLADAKAVMRAWDELNAVAPRRDNGVIVAQRGRLAVAMEGLRTGLAAEASASRQRALASLIRRMTPEQREARLAKLRASIAVIEEVQ